MDRMPKMAPLLMAFFIWFCTVPFVALLIVPGFGWSAGATILSGILAALLAACLAICRTSKGPGCGASGS